MEVKIRQGNEMLDATIEMVDGVMVVSPKKVKYVPKDGDVVYILASFEHIAIYKEEESDDVITYADLMCCSLNFGRSCSCSKENVVIIRPATEEEKQKLFDKLAEEGYEFDFEKKELVKLRWKPKEGEEFWLPLYYASPSEFEPIKSLLNKGRDKAILDKGWCFKIKEECQAFCDRLNETLNQVKP